MENFSQWLDPVLAQPLPENVAAINFNLYDDGDHQWSIELIGSPTFSPDDADWACEEVFDNRDEPLCWESRHTKEQILQQAEAAVRDYLDHGRHAGVLKSLQGVGVGFVDGDLVLVYRRLS